MNVEIQDDPSDDDESVQIMDFIKSLEDRVRRYFCSPDFR